MMNLRADISPILILPTRAQANRAVQESRRMFAKTLSCWAMDVLALRRGGAGEPVWTPSVSFRQAA